VKASKAQTTDLHVKEKARLYSKASFTLLTFTNWLTYFWFQKQFKID